MVFTVLNQGCSNDALGKTVVLLEFQQKILSHLVQGETVGVFFFFLLIKNFSEILFLVTHFWPKN